MYSKKLCESLLNYFKILKGSAIEYDAAKNSKRL